MFLPRRDDDAVHQEQTDGNAIFCLEILSTEDEKSINLVGTKMYTENIL